MDSQLNIFYIVTTNCFWDKLPYTQELTCGKVRFTNARFTPTFPYAVHFTKASAKQTLNADLILIRETHLGDNSWHYQKIK